MEIFYEYIKSQPQGRSATVKVSWRTMATKAIFIVATVLVSACFCAEKYTTQYDNIDVDEILRSERLLKNYINCLDGTGSCTPDGKELKGKLILKDTTFF